MSNDHTAWDELAAGYAVNALEPEDEQAFAGHLRGCDRCRATLATMHEVAGEMAGAAEPADPPPALRQRILDAAVAERAAVFGSAPPAEYTTPVRPLRPARPAMRRRALVAVAAGFAFLALAGWNFALRTDNVAQQAALQRRTEALRCLAAPDSPRFQLTSGTGRRATTCLAGGSAYVVADRLDVNDATSSVYVLWWLDQADVPHAVERFDVESADAVVFELPIDAEPGEVSAMAISLEPGRRVPARPTRPVASGEATPG